MIRVYKYYSQVENMQNIQNMHITLEYAEYVQQYAEYAEYMYPLRRMNTPHFRMDIPFTVWTYPLSYAQYGRI